MYADILYTIQMLRDEPELHLISLSELPELVMEEYLQYMEGQLVPVQGHRVCATRASLALMLMSNYPGAWLSIHNALIS